MKDDYTIPDCVSGCADAKDLSHFDPPKIYKVRCWVEGPKFAKLPSLLKKMAIAYNIDIEIECDKGWFSEIVYYTIEGTKEQLQSFDRTLKTSIQEYNET